MSGLKLAGVFVSLAGAGYLGPILCFVLLMSILVVVGWPYLRLSNVVAKNKDREQRADALRALEKHPLNQKRRKL